MQSKTCCFSGHRDIPYIEQNMVTYRLEAAIRKMIENGVIYFGSGGAIGFDLMAARAVLKLRGEYPQIRLILVLPCYHHTAKWSQSQVDELEDIVARADKVVFTSEEYNAGCMHKRDRHLVNHSKYCICYLVKPKGGTAYTVGYAKCCGLEIVNVGHAPHVVDLLTDSTENDAEEEE